MRTPATDSATWARRGPARLDQAEAIGARDEMRQRKEALDDGLDVGLDPELLQRVLAAVEESSANESSWVPVGAPVSAGR
ncbi:hypothetical protein [Microbacterium sp. LWH3-1.2]|uniref:hypothetical protein n=1 Tax=Microbacterium sp. LWH3-1.2 TaxID=3135256 RepID=UPI0034296E39